MTEFSRSLPEHGLCTLRKMAGSADANWWKDLLSLWRPSGIPAGCDGLRIAVRRNYLNFYRLGQSVAKVGFDREGVAVADVHIKYAFPESATDQGYVRLNGTDIWLKDDRQGTYEGKKTLLRWVAETDKYKGEEKAFVDDVVGANTTVIDLEIGIPAWGDRKSALRMDVVSLELNAGEARIVFWEAKTIKNSGIKSKTVPKVLKQIEDYREYSNVPAHHRLIVSAYQCTCKLLCELHKMVPASEDCPPLDKQITAVGKGTVVPDVDPTPRLIIFDDKPVRATSWDHHEAKLRKNGVRLIVYDTPPYVLRQPDARM
jgi:hypothetical protein